MKELSISPEFPEQTIEVQPGSVYHLQVRRLQDQHADNVDAPVQAIHANPSLT